MKEKRLYIHEVSAGNKRVVNNRVVNNRVVNNRVVNNRVVNNRVVSKSDFGRQGEKRRLCPLKSEHS